MDFKTIIYGSRDGIAKITINRAKRMNGYNETMVKEMCAAIDLARQATAGDPTNTVAWLTLGAAYEASGRSALARTAYRNCAAQGRGDRVAECRALLAQ